MPSDRQSPFLSAIKQGLNPDPIDAFTPLGYTPTPKQLIFHDLSAQRLDALLYGGAVGGGKTAALLMDAIHNAVNYPGMVVGCFRRTFPELQESLLDELSRRDFAKALGARWNVTEHNLYFPNGSQIRFRYAENEQDVSRRQGGQYQLICVDEATLTPPLVIQRLEERLRTGKRGCPVIGLRLSGNPGGISHTYIKDRFVTPTDRGEHLHETIRKNGQRVIVGFVPSKLDDNPYINKEYATKIDDIPDMQRRMAMRDGNWDAMVGAFFNFDRDRHGVPSFVLSDAWQRYCGIDYGFAAPFAVVWAAVDNDDRLWVYRELYATGVDAHSQAKAILDSEKSGHDKDVIRVADPSMWGHRGTPLTIADIYGLEGCGVSQADNDRTTGWSRVHSYLGEGPPCEYHRSLDWDTCPMLHYFSDRCPFFATTMAELPRNELNPDDAATKNVADHIPDATRYLCSHVGTSARPVFYDDRPTSSPTDRRIADAEASSAYNPHGTQLVFGKFAGDLRLNPYQ